MRLSTLFLIVVVSLLGGTSYVAYFARYRYSFRACLNEWQRFTFSVLTRYEILRGLRDKNAVRQELAFDALCRVSRVLPLTDPIAVRAAAIYADLKRRGELVGDADILIAATALEHGLAVATGNIVHFERIPGLRITNWREQTLV